MTTDIFTASGAALDNLAYEKGGLLRRYDPSGQLDLFGVPMESDSALRKRLLRMIEKSVAIDLLELEVARLKLREQDLLEANNRYLERARKAEAALLNNFPVWQREAA